MMCKVHMVVPSRSTSVPLPYGRRRWAPTIPMRHRRGGQRAVKRRRFIEATSAGTAAALWLRDAFADAPACDKDWAARVAQVAAAFRRGQEAGKRLLVLVIPADDEGKTTRGQAFGELLN